MSQNGRAALWELRRAVELSPSNAEAHVWLGWIHLLGGRPVDALAATRRGVELDPLAPAFRAYLAEALLARGRAEEALREAERAIEIQPDYGLAHFIEGLTLYHLGRFERAAAAVEAALGLVGPGGTPRQAEVLSLLAVVRAAEGEHAAARALLARIDGAEHPFSRGLVLAALGHREGALAAFERVRVWDSFATDHFRYFFPAVLGPLREDARFGRIGAEIDLVWG